MWQVCCFTLVEHQVNGVDKTKAQFGSTFTPVIVIAGGLFWTGFDDFDANVAFTSLAFISLASDPIGMILTAWSRLGALVASFERIQNYLQLEERADDRGELHQLPVTCDEKQPLYNLADFPVQLHEACICPIGDKPPLLRANISLARSSVNMIIGPTACGKSTLLKGLLGEASIIQGSVHIQPGCVAYCSQETWLRNVSIRDNIIGEFLYDEVWYNTVTTMCLLRDLEEFPEGHGSLAGSRGSNLSGGQRQRIVSQIESG
jgi:ABC-type multidrug transport system fused ATPase/permease subunit